MIGIALGGGAPGPLVWLGIAVVAAGLLRGPEVAADLTADSRVAWCGWFCTPDPRRVVRLGLPMRALCSGR